MAEALSLQLIVKVVSELTNVLDLSTPIDAVTRDYTKVFANGTGLNQANMVWHDQRTLTASAAETLDLAGSLVSTFGTTITFTAVKGILVAAAVANTNDVQVTRPASGLVVFLASGDGLPVRPGGVFLWVDPTAAGVAVTPTTGDLLTLTNSAGSTSVTYDIVLWGKV